MPGPLRFVTSGVHRAACFSLYRALLRRSQQVLPSEPGKLFKKSTQDVFRANAKARSLAAVRAALDAGYTTLKDLAISGDDVHRQLSKLSYASTTAPALREEKNVRLGTSSVAQSRFVRQPTYTGRRQPHPDAKPVLDGLPPTPPGKLRRVPTLVNANHIPFLRLKKPQSPFLSYIIRKKNDEREKRVDKMQALEKQLAFAEDEDQWDRIMKEEHGISTDDHGARWASATREALTNVQRVHQTNTMKRMRIAQRMFDLLQEQKTLAEQERRERRDQRHQASKARRRQREEAASTTPQNNPSREDNTPAASAAAV